MSRPFSPRTPPAPAYRINGKIRAREVRVIGPEGNQMGIMALNDALGLARQHGVDLVEVAPNATPPVCRVIDYGKFRYEQAKMQWGYDQKIGELQAQLQAATQAAQEQVRHRVHIAADHLFPTVQVEVVRRQGVAGVRGAVAVFVALAMVLVLIALAIGAIVAGRRFALNASDREFEERLRQVDANRD